MVNPPPPVSHQPSTQLRRFARLRLLLSTTVVLAVLLIGFLLFTKSFSPPPPPDLIQAAVARSVGKTVSLGDGFTQNDLAGYGLGNKLKNFKITNHYTRKVDGEKIFVFDYVAQVSSISGEQNSEGAVYFVKRGEKWYWR